jgi:hypothetical protein
LLIANNGSRKTGTTWVQQGLYHLFDIEPLPREFRNPVMWNESVREDAFKEFLSWHDQSKLYYSKSHFRLRTRLGEARARKVLLDDRIVLVNSIRNVGDAIVSWYYHQGRVNKTTEPFENWFASEGLAFTKQYGSHHAGWHTDAAPFLFSYEKLKHDYKAQMVRFVDCSGLTPKHPIPANLNEWAGIDEARRREPSPHLRAGRIGDHREIMTPEMCAEVERVLAGTKFFEVMVPVCERWEIDFDALLPWRCSRARGRQKS